MNLIVVVTVDPGVSSSIEKWCASKADCKAIILSYVDAVSFIRTVDLILARRPDVVVLDSRLPRNSAYLTNNWLCENSPRHMKRILLDSDKNRAEQHATGKTPATAYVECENTSKLTVVLENIFNDAEPRPAVSREFLKKLKSLRVRFDELRSPSTSGSGSLGVPVLLNDHDRLGAYLAEVESQLFSVVRQRDDYREELERIQLQFQSKEPETEKPGIPEPTLMAMFLALESDLNAAMQTASEWRRESENQRGRAKLFEEELQKRDDTIEDLADLLSQQEKLLFIKSKV